MLIHKKWPESDTKIYRLGSLGTNSDHTQITDDRGKKDSDHASQISSKKNN